VILADIHLQLVHDVVTFISPVTFPDASTLNDIGPVPQVELVTMPVPLPLLILTAKLNALE
jgi:hypothetical protein